MKTILLYGTALAILGVAAVPLSAQTQSTTSTSTTNYIQTSKLIGTKVKASEGEEVGEIKDVVLDQNGCMAYTVVSTGGTGSRLTGSSKTVAVPWSVYQTSPDFGSGSGSRVVTVRVQKDRIYSAPVFEYSRIREYSTGGYINNVNSYYGVSATGGVSTSVSGSVSGSSTTTSGTTTTGTGASTNATPIASPGASVSATPLGTPAPTATASATAAASPSATVAASATPSITPMGTATPNAAKEDKADKGNKAKSGMTPVSPRHHTDATSGSGDNAAGSSPSKKNSDASSDGSPAKKKRSHATESGEPSSTPKAESDQ